MQRAIDAAAAEAYHLRHGPQALLVACGERVELERYDDGFNETKPHALYSGTKSFWGIAALTAEREGLLDLDEPVGRTFPAWGTGLKGNVTLRHLLTLTAGIGFGGLGASVPVYEKALAVELHHAPGVRFTYGGIPLQVFGAVFAHKLEPLHLTPHQYLKARVLDPAGVEVSSWRELKDGTHPLPTGAFLTARNWQRFGAFVAARAGEFAECFKGTGANPRYGLAWWLAPPGVRADLVYASGSNGQALYVVPSLKLVAVRFGNGGSYKHETFLKRLFG